MYDQLLTFQSFELFKDNKSNKDKDFVHIGGGQYHNTLKTFIRFLNAMQLFSANRPSFSKKPSTNNLPLQQIFYGAPGTGKSHGIKENEGDFSKVIRTTFHPDSDYSTFVGAYKPTMTSKERIYSADELIGKLTTIKESGISYPCHKFSAQYWESLKDLPASEIKRIINACGFTDTMTVEIGKGISIGQELASKSDDKKITYTFVKQAFLKAYIEAWNRHDKGENVLLVIEEINRGNCAQIFGDLFQLLDRNDEGYSDYPIQADEDIRMVLADEFVNLDNIPENVKSGEELLLPNNLYIWATMNTSDQSLFPIDSAFKRRWEWKYVPIEKPKKENGLYFDWAIQLNGYECDWWEFIEALNQQIFDTTESEDKQLGYFFVKAKDGVIDADTFVNKVVFYLWNDVFKDENSDIFNYNEKVWADNDKKDLNDKIINLLNKKNLSFSTFAKDRELLSHYFIDSILQKAGKGLMTIISEDSVDLEDEEINTPNFDETKESRKEYWKLFADEYGRNNLTRQNVDERDKHFLDIKLGFAKLYIANTYLASQNKAAVSLYATDQEIGKAFLKYIENNYQKEGISKALGGDWKDKNKNALFEYECISKDKKAMAKEMAKKAHQFCDIFKRVVAEFKNNYKNK
ncbi:MAG: hypothetical protein MJZ18_08675 [Bacteroidales bacterium]|nr:hypothetical protein [Bacteroidales bacterium]